MKISTFFFLGFLFFSSLKAELPKIDRHKFDEVLLVVNFNHPHYDSIPFIRKLYAPLFPNIVFYGEKPHPDVYNVELYFGVYCIRTVADALARFPNYKGYLFLQDDCLLNVWNFKDLDLNKLWLAISRYPSGTSGTDVPPSWDPDFEIRDARDQFIKASIDGMYREHWGWWVPHVYGLLATQKAYPNLDYTALKQLEKNIGKNTAIAQTCDMFYIPQKFRRRALLLTHIFWDVFYEISVPMMFCCLDSLENWELLRMYWGFSQEHFLEYRTDFHWIHPLKFSKEEHRKFVSDLLNDYYKTLE